MMTSSNENVFRVTRPLYGEFTSDRWIPRTKAGDAELWRFLDLLLTKRLSKQWWGWSFETPSRSSWRHCNERNDMSLIFQSVTVLSWFFLIFINSVPQCHRRNYSISQEICTLFCCALLCCGYAIVHNEFTWSIYPYSSGLLCWHWGNR